MLKGMGMAILAFLLVHPVETEAQEAAKKLNFTGDIGFVNTAGNTHLTTVSVGDKLTVQAGKVLLTQTFALVYGESEGVQNANSQLVRGRADFPITARLSAYAFLGYERNRFAGISRRTDQGVGLALAAIRETRHELDVETGAGLVQQALIPDPNLAATVSDNFVSGRAAVRYKLLFSKATYFQQVLEYLPNLEHGGDYRINSESVIVAPISRHFGLKAGYLIKYNNAPPSAGLEKTDRMFTTGLQVSY